MGTLETTNTLQKHTRHKQTQQTTNKKQSNKQTNKPQTNHKPKTTNIAQPTHKRNKQQ